MPHQIYDDINDNSSQNIFVVANYAQTSLNCDQSIGSNVPSIDQRPKGWKSQFKFTSFNARVNPIDRL